jgi:hypothetical protein
MSLSIIYFFNSLLQPLFN